MTVKFSNEISTKKPSLRGGYHCETMIVTYLVENVEKRNVEQINTFPPNPTLEWPLTLRDTARCIMYHLSNTLTGHFMTYTFTI